MEQAEQEKVAKEHVSFFIDLAMIMMVAKGESTNEE